MVVLRKRKAEPSASSNGLQAFLEASADCKRLLIFTGSGLSATSGMSTFSTRGGLYERAQKRFAVQDGKKLFTFAFFEKQRLEAMAFFADIYAEAKRAKPSLGHRALASVAAQGKLQRHYTLNIDGLAQAVGLSTWHPVKKPTGQTLEMHGSIREMVCPECGHVTDLTAQLLRAVRAKTALPCPKCREANLRMRIMLYDDGEADVITPDDVFDVLEEDVRDADMILWVGISFQQSASTAYFRRVRGYLQEAGRLQTCKQAVINLSEDCLWNLLSSCSNVDNLNVMEVLASADEAMPALAERLAGVPPSFSAAPAVPSHASAPSRLPSSATQLVAAESRPVSAPAAKRHAGVPPSMSVPAGPSHASAAADSGGLPVQLVPEAMHPTSTSAAERPAGSPPSTSAPAVLSESLAPVSAVSMPEQHALEMQHVSATDAAPLNGHAPMSEQAAVSMHDGSGETPVARPGKGAVLAPSPCSTVADETSPRQATAPVGDGSRLRPMSSAALSESPAALAMPTREDLAQE
ncbi:g6884 [Coccomyxa viridis]|uniref:G6884 protein n=1 Tax=Coccomyxa viridis TaxID=1274662 RepID=A0ABP1G323_9CHLO